MVLGQREWGIAGLQLDAVDFAVQGLSRVIGEPISFDSAATVCNWLPGSVEHVVRHWTRHWDLALL